jgi:hypothetical protein
VLDIEEDDSPSLDATVFLNPTRSAEHHVCERAVHPRIRLADAPTDP